MKQSRFREDQMVKILREADKSPVARVAKKHGISEQTIYAWRNPVGSFLRAGFHRARPDLPAKWWYER